MSLKTIRLTAYVAIAAVLILGGAAFAILGGSGLSKPSLLIPPTTTIGGPFHLTDQTGKPVTDKDLLGKPAAMFFGYTFCPDVCPTTLAEVGDWLKALGPDADKLQFVFVTVDPERDTQDKLKDYLTSFDPRIRGLTGTPQETAAIVKDYRVYVKKTHPESGSDYLVDHTAAVYLMDSKGRFVGFINYQEDASKTIAKLKELLAQG
ncbi:MAG: SCO family protein [Ancalomicrobiaceae bacterium]|nr:SCO family protein [Ancalomicrobiaceae bacterium]